MNKTQEKEMKTANQKRNTQKKKIFKKIITGKDKQEKNKKIKSRRTKMIEKENRKRCVRTYLLNYFYHHKLHFFHYRIVLIESSGKILEF